VLTGAIAGVYFAPLGDWFAADPILPGQSWVRSHLFLGAVLCVLVGLGAALLVDATRPAKVPELNNRVYANDDPTLTDLRLKVNDIWIRGVLDHSLEAQVPLELGFARAAGALHSNISIRRGGSAPVPATTIEQIFKLDEAGRRLLIVGRPGSGKSTQLLHLLRSMLQDADLDPEAPVPVLLPLSAGNWTRIGRSIGDALAWMASEIEERYEVPKAQVERWLTAEKPPLIMLLDGLDEITASNGREACVQMLSRLRTGFAFGMVVACRRAEYFELRSRLHFGIAVEILPLTAIEVDQYLAAAGPPAVELRKLFLADSSLMELFQDPLALVVAVLAYRGRKPGSELLEGSVGQRLDRLWEQYIQQMLHRRRDEIMDRIGNPRYPPHRTRDWLGNIAYGMHRQSRIEFQREIVNLEWLPEPLAAGLRRTVHTIWALISLAGAGMLLYSVAVQHGLHVTLVAMAVTVVSTLTLAILGWGRTGESATEARFDPKRLLDGLWVTLLGGIGISVAVALFAGPYGLVVGLVPFALLGPVVGVGTAFATTEERRPGDPLPRSRKPELSPFPYGREYLLFSPEARLGPQIQLGVVALVAAIPVATILLVTGPLASVRFAQVTLAVCIGPSIGAAWTALSAVVVPGVIGRLALPAGLAMGAFPRPLGRFLEHANERILMRRSSDGHQFLHISLQDHLAGTSTGHRFGGRPFASRRWTPAAAIVPNPRRAADRSVIERIRSVAASEAAATGSSQAGTEHLLIGLLREDSEPVATIRAKYGLVADRVRHELDRTGGSEPSISASPTSDRMALAVQRAEMEAAFAGDSDIRADHVLMAILQDPECRGFRLLRRLGVTADDVRRELDAARADMPATGLGGAVVIAAPDIPHRTRPTAVILVLQHDHNGALGLLLNEPAEAAVHEYFPEWSSVTAAPSRVFTGGAERPQYFFCLGRLDDPSAVPNWSVQVSGRIHVLETSAENASAAAWPGSIRIFAGHLSWPAGQLERELSSGSLWLAGIADNEPFTDTPGTAYSQLARRPNLARAWLEAAARAGNHHADAALGRLNQGH
jgi:putative AlgH/UPF0301 family transcriptional regulator/energy-coupling factor transporter ATP-binding protein EcfA2